MIRIEYGSCLTTETCRPRSVDRVGSGWWCSIVA